MPKQIIVYVNHKKNAWIVWTADFSGPHPDVLMREYPLTLTRTEAVGKFKRDFGL